MHIGVITAIVGLLAAISTPALAGAQFRMQVPTVLLSVEGSATPPDDSGLPPDNGTSSPIEIYAAEAGAGRALGGISIPVVIAGATGSEIVTLDAPSGAIWVPAGDGNGTISWPIAEEGTYDVSINVADIDGTPKATKTIALTVHGALTASVPQSAYEVMIGDELTIAPSILNLIAGEGTARWGATQTPSWLSLDDVTGEIAVDTSSSNSVENIVLTAVDQTDLASASTAPFSVKVKGACDVWTLGTSAAANIWNSVTYGNGTFVAVAANGTTDKVMTSPDGLTWTGRTAPAAQWRSVTYGNGVFVAVADSGSTRVMTSTDGITWTGRTAPVSRTWASVAYGNGVFVAVASGVTANQVMTSPDGITWTARTEAVLAIWKSITYGGGLFVAVASSGTSSRVMTSPNGTTWTARTAAVENLWQEIRYGDGKFVVVADQGSNRVMTSSNGVTWTAGTTPVGGWRSVAYGNGLFVATSFEGTNRVMTSPDGITWTPRAVPENVWYSVAYGGGKFVAVSWDGQAMTSNCH